MSIDVMESESYRRLRWQCRRGLLELDLLFMRFLDERYEQLNDSERDSFQELLRQPDQNLLAWVQGNETAPTELQSILRKVI